METQIWSARIIHIKNAQNRLTHTSYVVSVSQNFDLRPCLEKDSWLSFGTIELVELLDDEVKASSGVEQGFPTIVDRMDLGQVH